jgi:hypothetical protein
VLTSGQSTRAWTAGSGSGLGCRRLLHDDVGVGAADAEGGDGGAARASGRARQRLGEQADVARGPVDVRARLVGVQGAGRSSVLHSLIILMTPGDAGGGLGVADVRLDRAEPQRPVSGAVLP